MSKLHDVIIAGAGPIGLFLACELALANVSVIVIERDAQPESPWKERALGLRGLNTTSVEAFYRRGMLDEVVDAADKRPEFFQPKPGGFQFGGHFAGILLNANKLEISRYKYRLPGPALLPNPSYMQRVEKALTDRAVSLGVTILRGTGVSDVSQDDDEVKVQAGNQTFRTKWLVGCDGGRSTVRKAAGFDFVGTEPEFTGYAFLADLDHPEKLNPGFHFGKGGMHIVGHENNYFLLDFQDTTAFDRTKEPTQEHLQAVLERVAGIDVKITKLHLASSFTDRSKQTTSYRKGRILLAGDAAHIHSPLGAQGLNLGLGDAMNLGWKLASTIHASNSGAPADLRLLDTYEKERHPLGAWVLEWTRAQVATMRLNLFGTAIRNLVKDLLDTPDGTNLVIDRIWGLSLRYDLGDAHPLVGCSAPDFEFDDGTRLGVKMQGGRGLLISFDDDAEIKKLAGDYEGKVGYVGVGAKEKLGISALLVRPDGFVAWVAEDKLDIDSATAALGRWFGSVSK